VVITSNGSSVTVNCSNSITVAVLNAAPTLSDLNVSPTNCYALGASSMAFNWAYVDAENNPQTGYQIQITSNPANFDEPSVNQCVDCEIADEKPGNATTTNFDVIVDNGEATIDNKLHFSYKVSDPTHPMQYYWRVKVSDATHPLSSAIWYYGTGTITIKANAIPFQTPLHPYPYVSFTPKVSPVTLSATYANSIFYDMSICFNNDGTSYYCACGFTTPVCNSFQLANSYKWWFINTSTDWLTYVGTNIPDSTTKPSLESANKTVAYWQYRNNGIYKPVSQVCDGTTPTSYCCYGTSNMSVRSPGGVPVWQEISPLE
ncbi:MAG: hypothetical protein WCK10_03485, partial [Candidatus Staskawiczbacteria bacterium]